MRYFIGKNGQQLGPFDAQQVREQLAAGAISYDDLVWRDGMAAWAPVRTEFPPLGPTNVTPPGVTTSAYPASSAPNPFFAPEAADEPALATRGRRLGAASIDHFLVFLCLIPGLIRLIPPFLESAVQSAQTNQHPNEAAIQQMILSSFGLLIVPVLALGVLQAVLLSLRGQTIGKLLCKIRIVRTNGERAGFVHAFLLRSVLMGFVTSVPVIGGLIALIDPLLIFREDHRCLHDLLAGTAVVGD